MCYISKSVLNIKIYICKYKHNNCREINQSLLILVIGLCNAYLFWENYAATIQNSAFNLYLHTQFKRLNTDDNNYNLVRLLY